MPRDIHEFIDAHREEVRTGVISDVELAKRFNKSVSSVRAIRNRANLNRKGEAAETADHFINVRKERTSNNSTRRANEILMDEVERLRKEREAWLRLQQGPLLTKIEPLHASGTSEATFFTVASDWHIEERVRPDEVNGLNAYTLDIAIRRSEAFFQRGLKLYRMFSRDVKIDTWVLPLLGDFITSNIHDELAETAQLAPADAIWKAQNLIASGIDFLLNNTEVKLIIPCKSGNHGRITKEQRHATEEGNSLESFMYKNLALHYKNEKRVQFIISDGYHIYLNVYNQTLRIHHGHSMRYGGGVGGIYIPVNKALAQWNKAKTADLDIFGHFHQFRDGGNFICNGSLIGYNAYALSIKAEFERPQQASFLIDKKRGKTIVAPLLFQ